MGDLQRVWDSGLHVQALTAAVEAWRTSRDPRLADVIGRWGDVLEPEIPVDPTATAFHARWLDVLAQGDITTVGWLAATLDARLEHASTARRRGARSFDMAVERVAALARSSDDPRIAAGLVQVLQRGRHAPIDDFFEQETDPFYEACADLLQRVADVRALPVLRHLLAHPLAPRGATRRVLAMVVPGIIERLEGIETRAAPDVPSLPAPVRPALGLEEVYRDPDDRALRAAVADALQEVGSLRGEFIAMQLAGREETRRREAALFREHRAEWMGPLLDAVLAKPVFVDGFLESASMKRRPVDDRTAEEAARDPRLSTLRNLEVGSGYGHHLLQLLRSPHLAALDAVEIGSRGNLAELVTLPPMGVGTLRFGFPTRSDDRRALAVLSTWPSLHTLHIRTNRTRFPEAVDTLERAGLMARVGTLWLQTHPDLVDVVQRIGDRLSVGVGTPDSGVLVERHADTTWVVATRALTLPKLVKLCSAVGASRVRIPAPKSAAQRKKVAAALEGVDVRFSS